MQINRIEYFRKIVEELSKIIAYFYVKNPEKKDESENNGKKDRAQKKKDNENENRIRLRKDYPPGYVQMTEIYMRFYSKCLERLKKGEKMGQDCEPTYRTFYEMYLDPEEYDLDNVRNEHVENNIGKIRNNLKRNIDKYYKKIKKENNNFLYRLDLCECESVKDKELCLCVKENPETISKEKDNDEMVVDYGKSEKVLANIKRKGLALYAHFLGVVFPLEFAAIVSVYYIIGFFVALFTHKIFVTNMNDIFEILLFTAIMIIISFIEIYKDYAKLLDSSGKRALSNITKLSLIPFFSIKEKKFVNTLNKNIVAYKQNDGYITLSIFDVQCPICNNAGHKNRLIARNKKNDIIFECSGEKLHKFSFDKVLKTGKLVHNFLQGH